MPFGGGLHKTQSMYAMDYNVTIKHAHTQRQGEKRGHFKREMRCKDAPQQM